MAGLAASASAQDKLDRALREASRSGKAERVIFKSKAGYEAWARKLLTDSGKNIDAELPSVGSFTVELTAGEMEVLCNSTVSDGCSVDAVVSPSARPRKGAPLAAFFAPQVNTLLRTLGLAPNSFGGLGVTVALIDSGIYPSAAFDKRIKAFYDFTDGGIRSAHPFDDYGHGTHVAGLIGGQQSLTDLAFEGVAPSVQFVGLKVLDKTGSGKTSNVIRAIEFAIANRAKYDIDIINLSLGHPIYEPAATDPLVQAVERATKAGIIVVAAAGNRGVNTETGLPGYAGVTSPGNAPSAITSGALMTKDTVSRNDDRIPDYSSSGPSWYDAFVKPDLLAPGHNIVAIAARNGALYKKYPNLRAADADYM
ncbi:MAG: S8 family serine peptidase, partial [Vicinamibacterales bacterium]